MLVEADRQTLAATGVKTATHAFVPVGVGSIAQAVTQHHKSQDVESSVAILTVEPDTAAGLKTSISAGRITPVTTQDSIMCGMNCGTVSSTAWAVLKSGVDACVVVTDAEAHRAVVDLEELGVKTGPCGAATLAALRRACEDDREKLAIGKDAVVVLYCTEGPREYEVPQ
jgi:diaminopropionate ammonia-lyase